MTWKFNLNRIWLFLRKASLVINELCLEKLYYVRLYHNYTSSPHPPFINIVIVKIKKFACNLNTTLKEQGINNNKQQYKMSILKFIHYVTNTNDNLFYLILHSWVFTYIYTSIVLYCIHNNSCSNDYKDNTGNNWSQDVIENSRASIFRIKN